jgi:hypothetical protein
MASTHGVKLENSIDVDEKNYHRKGTDNDSQQPQKRKSIEIIAAEIHCF